jgi:hypothetical protein
MATLEDRVRELEKTVRDLSDQLGLLRLTANRLLDGSEEGRQLLAVALEG